MQFIEYNKENQLVLNQIYVIAELQNQEKHITQCKDLVYIEIKNIDPVDKVTKEATKTTVMTSIKLPYKS